MRELAILLGVISLVGGCRHDFNPAPADRGRDSFHPGTFDGWIFDGPRPDGPRTDGPRTDGPRVTVDSRLKDRTVTPPDQPPKPDKPRDTTPPCGPGNCSGCCAGGLCVAAPSNGQCGANGAPCQSCPSGRVCVGGQCVCQPAGPITTDPAGCVAATCSGWPAPQVRLTWCSQPNQTANAVQRGICCPGDPTFSWQAIWGDPTLLLREWTDTSVSPNVTYTYRVKFRPDLASNNINVPVTACNCGG